MTWLKNLPSRTEVQAEKCRRRLYDFVRHGWAVVEPGTPLIDNWHLGAVCAHLEAITRGDIRQLLINIPPGHMKSLLVSVFWPAWEWIEAPETRSLFSSYAMELAIRDSVRCRDLVTSDWYAEWFAPEWRLRADQNLKSYFENDRKGFRFCLSVGGRATGFRGQKVVVDDPLNAKDVRSAAALDECIFWWDQVMSTRLNDPRTGARVIIMQRLHEKDLSGHVLARGGYEHLCLPSEFDPARKSATCIGWEDPRAEPDELLFPELFPASVLAELKTVLGAVDYAGQHDQHPVPKEGAFFKVAQVGIVDAAPAGLKWVRAWDQAATEGAGDFTAGVRMGRGEDGLFYVADVARGQWGTDTRNREIRQTAALDGRGVSILGAQDPGSAGKDAALTFSRLLAGYRVKTERVSGDKETRADPFSAQVNAGNVRLVTGDWNRAFLDELRTFPLGAHDDQVDAAADAFNELTLSSAPIRALQW